ncbi:MAG: glycoside hydrolase family 27 protein [Oscillospiraceae bacterium]|nr:glycoside hydrolase family 27 protein [Oscillospiraceae bacterium]MBQ4311824.1 glycoside hydrolase family 27 protein [Oscillospiraceae bacterium]
MIAERSPMGWNSWDCYGASVTEDIVRGNAAYMAENLKKYGWEYIVVDIQWYEPTADSHDYHPFTELCMDGYSRLIPAENRFPSSSGGKGFSVLAEYVHSLGLKFGIHIMRGIARQAVHRNTPLLGTERTARQIAARDSVCHWNTDMYGVDTAAEGAQEYYNSIFSLYASWGVDLVKIDDIANHYPEAEIEMINRAARSSGRDMVLSLSPGPAPIEKAEHLKQYANMWRITDDFWDKWELLYDMFRRAETWCTHSGAGHWPDADMLPVGAILQDYDPENRTKFTGDEQKTMMTLWSIMRSPLMIGGELTKCDDFTLSLLTNSDILEMHRDSRSAHQVFRRMIGENEIILWRADRGAYRNGGGSYIAVFNAGETPAEVDIPLIECGIETPVTSFTEMWTKEISDNVSTLHAVIPPHGARAYLAD